MRNVTMLKVGGVAFAAALCWAPVRADSLTGAVARETAPARDAAWGVVGEASHAGEGAGTAAAEAAVPALQVAGSAFSEATRAGTAGGEAALAAADPVVPPEWEEFWDASTRFLLSWGPWAGETVSPFEAYAVSVVLSAGSMGDIGFQFFGDVADIWLDFARDQEEIAWAFAAGMEEYVLWTALYESDYWSDYALDAAAFWTAMADVLVDEGADAFLDAVLAGAMPFIGDLVFDRVLYERIFGYPEE